MPGVAASCSLPKLARQEEEKQIGTWGARLSKPAKHACPESREEVLIAFDLAPQGSAEKCCPYTFWYGTRKGILNIIAVYSNDRLGVM